MKGYPPAKIQEALNYCIPIIKRRAEEYLHNIRKPAPMRKLFCLEIKTPQVKLDNSMTDWQVEHLMKWLKEDLRLCLRNMPFCKIESVYTTYGPSSIGVTMYCWV